MAWPGPLARVLWRPHFLEPHQAGCGLNGLDHQITGQLMVEIRCKYARRPVESCNWAFVFPGADKMAVDQGWRPRRPAPLYQPGSGRGAEGPEGRLYPS